MFSEVSVNHSVHRGGGGLPPEGLPTHPPVLTSSGGHCSSQYTFYWNAFLLITRKSLSPFAVAGWVFDPIWEDLGKCKYFFYRSVHALFDSIQIWG